MQYYTGAKNPVMDGRNYFGKRFIFSRTEIANTFRFLYKNLGNGVGFVLFYLSFKIIYTFQICYLRV